MFNQITVLFLGQLEQSGRVLYKWTYPNYTASSQNETIYTVTPLVKIHPWCNASGAVSCQMTVTAFSGVDTQLASIDLSALNISDQDVALEPFQLGTEFSLDINCSTEAVNCCRGESI